MGTPQFVLGLEKLPFQSDALPVHKVTTAYGEIRFLMFGEITEFRVRTFFTKEPETLTWIDGFEPSDVFWDIGANIGCYSMYAACKGLKVCAFEPSPANFWLLAANSAMNNFGEQLVAYPFALSNTTKVLHWAPNVSPGSADNQLLAKGGSISGIQTYSIDKLAALPDVPFPTHLKLDVDGIEPLILAGAHQTLSDPRLSSMMIEVNEGDEEGTRNIVDLGRRNGFQKPVKRHSPYFDENHYLPVSNYIFRK